MTADLCLIERTLAALRAPLKVFKLMERPPKLLGRQGMANLQEGEACPERTAPCWPGEGLPRGDGSRRGGAHRDPGKPLETLQTGNEGNLGCPWHRPRLSLFSHQLILNGERQGP